MFTIDSIQDHYGLNKSFPNIAFLQTNVEDVFTDTPLEEWYEEGLWKNSSNSLLHLSDSSRLALIWKFGGIYLDLDIVMLKSMLGLRNFLIKQSEEDLCNGIFGFDNNHPFIVNCMYNLGKQCKKSNNSFGCGGPPMFTAIFKTMCGDSKKIKEEESCNIKILPVNSAFPVPYKEWRDYFNKSSKVKVNLKMKYSYLIHTWNFLSSKEKLRIGSGSAYEQAIRSNCPLVYEKVLKDNGVL
ncbi:lactosylceramide 4-alpha-galactosyltransferase-like [Centruroides sculpturatus]|uniref:lactosylceramide 4-alpha-galactosyltransferase-like n=1 Tax=Centruroides sculpturatus TaxID=218467 RepID=UPI000C6EAEE5|nr:lactosylceramide 4-alpha-galactosyltransferase-like [Centruroides sculpturatus]